MRGAQNRGFRQDPHRLGCPNARELSFPLSHISDDTLSRQKNRKFA